MPTSCRICCDGRREVAQAEADDSAVARRSGRSWLRRLLQSRGGLRARLEGRSAAGAEDSRPRRLHAWRSRRARRSSSNGRKKTGQSLPVSGPSCRSLTSSSATAALSFSEPICSRLTRCCSTRTIAPFACWTACRGAASMTTCETAVDRVGRGKERWVTRASRRWSAISCFEVEFCNLASVIEVSVGSSRPAQWRGLLEGYHHLKRRVPRHDLRRSR